MKLKTLTSVIFAACLFASLAVGQNLRVTGKVTAVTDTEITLVRDGQTWTIQRTPTTAVIDGTLKPGSTVTVQCKLPDGQKRE